MTLTSLEMNSFKLSNSREYVFYYILFHLVSEYSFCKEKHFPHPNHK